MQRRGIGSRGIRTAGSQSSAVIGHPRHRGRAHMMAIASGPREGRVMRQVRRAFIANGGKPRCMSELVAWAYPGLKHFECWHRWSVRRALLKIAKPIGRSSVGRGAPGIWEISV
jgi:hypothetical protein